MGVAAGYFAGAVGLLALMVGILGICAAYCRHWTTATVFIILTLIVGLLCLIAGGIVAFADFDTVKKEVCTQKNENYKDAAGEDTTGELYMKAQYGGMVDDFMCSASCPCKAPVLKKDLDTVPNLSKYGAKGRTKSTDVNPGTTVPMCMHGDTCAKNFKANTVGFSFYSDCYDHVIKKDVASSTSAQW